MRTPNRLHKRLIDHLLGQFRSSLHNGLFCDSTNKFRCEKDGFVRRLEVRVDRQNFEKFNFRLRNGVNFIRKHLNSVYQSVPQHLLALPMLEPRKH